MSELMTMPEDLLNFKSTIPLGYGYRIAHYLINLDEEVIFSLIDSKTKNSKPKYLVPVIDRTSDISPCIFADKAKYFLDFSDKKSKKCKESMCEILAEYDKKYPKEDISNKIFSVLSKIPEKYLKKIEPDHIILFKRSGSFITDEDNVKFFWGEYIKNKCNSDINGQCMYCLTEKRLINKIPYKPQNLDFINNNLPIFKSYCAKKEKYTFPICIDCIHKICSTISFLIENGNKFKCDNLLTIFWCDDEISHQKSKDWLDSFNDPKPSKVLKYFESPLKGEEIIINPNNFNILMFLQKKKGKASLLISKPYTFDKVCSNIRKWFTYVSCENRIYKLYEINYFLKKYIGKSFIKDLLDFALFAIPLPEIYICNIISKCKRNSNVKQIDEVLLSMFDLRDIDSKAYMLGGLFWEYENLQYRVMGKLNYGLKKKFFGLAIIRPKETFSKLLEHSKIYMRLLERNSFGLKVFFERKINFFNNKIGEFPGKFSIYDQVNFCHGYYNGKITYFNDLNKKR